MKIGTTILISLTVLQFATVGCTKHDETASVIQSRPEDPLIRNVKIGGFPTDPNPGLDALISEGPQVMPDLARLLQGNGPGDERIKAAEAMGAIAYHNPNAPEVQDTVPVLITAAQKGDSEVRYRAVQALGAMGQGASNAAPVLIRLTQDANPSVRMCAVEALGRIGADSPESIAALKVAQSDTSDDVRVTATRSLEIVQRDHK